MAAENNPANESPLDPLTSPSWMFEDDDDILLAPPLEEFFTDVATARSPGPAAPPPKIDDIITGGYTGWVPIIRAGESLAEAEARAEQTKNQKIEIDSVEVVEVIEVAVPSVSESILSAQENLTYVSAPIVDDPDLVSSPSQALDQARKRIAAMRASLQLNLNQVAESFAHPIFTPPAPVVTPEQKPVDTQDPESPTAATAPQVATSNVTATDVPVVDSASRLATDASANKTSFAATEQQTTEPTFEVPQATRFFTPTETQTQPETQVQAAPADHSLELMIMRD